MNDIQLRLSNALHLTQSAIKSGERGSGFQMVITTMISTARKNFMLMNMSRRI